MINFMELGEIPLSLDWKEKLSAEFEKKYFIDLQLFIAKEYVTKTCYPPKEKLFEALNICAFEAVKVVILGQDPYHNPSQAEGLAFSVPKGVAMPPSLKNIFKELGNDLQVSMPKNGSLRPWAEQGVLLLNTCLSVEENKPKSHQEKGWEAFTGAILKQLNRDKKNIVYILWGKPAQAYQKYIDATNNLILTSAHPSPLAAYRGFWNNHHFSQTNAYLKSKGIAPIQW